MPASRYKPFQTAGGAVDAVNVTSVPYSTMADTNVQRALEHLEDKAANAASNALNAQSSLTTVTATANAANATANLANTRALAANVTATAANITANGALQRTGGAMTGAITNLTVSGNATAANGVPSLSQVQGLISTAPNGGGGGGGGKSITAKGSCLVYIPEYDIDGTLLTQGIISTQSSLGLNTELHNGVSFSVIQKIITFSQLVTNQFIYRLTFGSPMSNLNYKVKLGGAGFTLIGFSNKTLNYIDISFSVFNNADFLIYE